RVCHRLLDIRRFFLRPPIFLAERAGEGGQTLWEFGRVRVHPIEIAVSDDGLFVIAKPCGGVRAEEFVSERFIRRAYLVTRGLGVFAQLPLARQMRQVPLSERFLPQIEFSPL